MNPTFMNLNSMNAQAQFQQFGGSAMGVSFGTGNNGGESAMGFSFGFGNQGEPAMDFSFGAGNQGNFMLGTQQQMGQSRQPYTFKANDQPNTFISPSAARMQFREAFPDGYRPRVAGADGAPIIGDPLGYMPGLSEYNFDNIHLFDPTRPGRQPSINSSNVALDHDANAGMGNVNQPSSGGSSRGQQTGGAMDQGGSAQGGYGEDVDMADVHLSNQLFGNYDQDNQNPADNYDWAGPEYPGMVRTLAQPDGTVFTFSDEDLDHIRETHEGGYQNIEADWSDEAAAAWVAENPDFDLDRLLADLEPLDLTQAQ